MLQLEWFGRLLGKQEIAERGSGFNSSSIRHSHALLEKLAHSLRSDRRTPSSNLGRGTISTSVVLTVKTPSLYLGQCGFDSHRSHHLTGCPMAGRDLCKVSGTVRFRNGPPFTGLTVTVTGDLRMVVEAVRLRQGPPFYGQVLTHRYGFIMSPSKRCTKCLQMKLSSEFHRNGTKLTAKCKSCHAIYVSDRRRERLATEPGYRELLNSRYRRFSKLWRAHPANRARAICIDSKKV